MKRQFVTLLSLALSGIIFTSASAGNSIELKSKTINSTAPFHLTKSPKGRGGDGIKGKILIAADAGFNATRAGLILKYAAYTNTYTPVITSTSGTPLINLGVDYGLGEKFSVGVAIGYQSITLNADAANNIIAGVDTWQRIHVAVRGDYYIVATDNISLYTGLKVGYNMYNVTSTYSSLDATYLTHLKASVVPQPTAIQPHFGFSYYIAEKIGINTEVALAFGGPYYFAVGCGIKL